MNHRTADPPVFPFIVGEGRSGTNLLRVMLTSHPGTALPIECQPIALGYMKRRNLPGRPIDRRAFVDDWAADRFYPRWGLPVDKVQSSFEESPPQDFPSAVRHLYSLYAEEQGKSRYGDKNPSNSLHLDRLAQMFPEGRFIHLVRDGRAVAASFMKAPFGPNTAAQAALRWRRRVRRARASGARLGSGRYLEITYEALVEDPERILRRVCDFIELPYEPAMLEYRAVAEPHVRSAPHPEQHMNLLKPPTPRLSDWRQTLSPMDVEIFEAIAGSELDSLGYGRETSPGPSALVRSAMAHVSAPTATVLRDLRPGLARRRAQVSRRIRRA